VTEALVKRAPDYFAYPIDATTLQAIKHAFYQVACFPNVVGAVGCNLQLHIQPIWDIFGHLHFSLSLGVL